MFSNVFSCSLLVILFWANAVKAQSDLLPLPLDDISIRNGVAFYQGRPFSGIAFTMTNGRKTVEIIYRNGYKDGNHTEWYQNGKKKLDYQFSNGKMLDGEYEIWNEAGAVKKTELYKAGNLIKEESFNKGKKNGASKEYYADGNIKSEGTYLNDLLNGTKTTYGPGNVIESVETYLQGKLQRAVLYSNNRIVESTVKDSTGTQIVSKTTFVYDATGNTLAEMQYDGNLQLHGICYEKWDANTIKWKRKYNHGQIEATIEENLNDPSKSIKTVFAKNPHALIGVAKQVTANPMGVDHFNIQIIYELGNTVPNTESFISATNNWLFNYRLKYVEFNSPEALDAGMIIKNYRATQKYISPQTYGSITIPGGYKCTLQVDVAFKSYRPGYPDEVRTAIWESRKLNTAAEAEEDAGRQVGSKIADMLYTELPIACKVIAIKEARNNGKAKTVIIDAGSAVGIYNKGRMRVFDITDPSVAGGNIIAHLEATNDISADRTVCKVLDGDEELTNLLNSGKTYKVVFP